jgi:hypothetical protein
MKIKNTDLENKLKIDGYALVNALQADDCEKLNALFLDFFPNPDYNNGLLISILEQDINIRRKVHFAILEQLSPIIGQYFENYKAAIAHFFVKFPLQNNPVPIHQDPMITDQAHSPSYGLWFALNNIDENNGGIQLIPGSHTIFPPFQSESFDPVFQENISAFNPYLKSIFMQQGQLLIMDNRLVHGSLPNNSDTIRVAPIVKITSKKSDYLIVYKNYVDECIYAIKQHKEFYLDATWLDKKMNFPDGEIVGKLNFPFHTLEENEIKRLIEEKPNNNNISVFDYLQKI